MSLLESLQSLFLNKTVPAHPLIDHNNNFFKNQRHLQPIGKCDFVVIDTELTGLNEKKDEIIAIGAIRIRDFRLQCGENFYALIKPEEKLHSQSTLVHRITPGQLTQAKSLEDILPQFLEFCGDSYLVGHYVRLDLAFLNRASKKLLGGVIKTPYLDTMRLAMAYKEFEHGHYFDHYNIRTAYSLTSLGKEYGLPTFEQHNALQDSLQTAYLFLYLVKKIKQYGPRTMHDFLHTGRQWKIIL
nr:3'-5' exonuclease [Desulfobulbaceae bacterium]